MDRGMHRTPLVAKSSLERELFIVNLLVRVHFVIVMIRWTGLAPWESGFRVSGCMVMPPPSTLPCTAPHLSRSPA